MRRPIVPFLTPPDEAVSHGEWLLKAVDGDVPLPKEVPHWDYQTTLELAAPVSVDRRSVTEACHLERTSGLAVLVMAKSSHTNAEVLAARLDLPMADTFDLAVELRLEGSELFWSSPTPNPSTDSHLNTPAASSGARRNGPISKASELSSRPTRWTSVQRAYPRPPVGGSESTCPTRTPASCPLRGSR